MMWKRITVWLGCLLLLQACGLNGNQEQEKKREAAEQGETEKLLFYFFYNGQKDLDVKFKNNIY